MLSVGSVGAERQVTNVAAGQLSAASTDAVNGSQLFATNQAVDDLGLAMSGLDTTVGGIGSTVTNLGNTVTNLGNSFDNVVNNGAGIKYFHSNSTQVDSAATGTDSLAAGPAAVASATNAVAIGNGANASEANSVAIGSGSTTEAAVPVLGGTLDTLQYTYAGGAPVGVFSIGSLGAERQLTHVAAGRISADSTDAVNGSQLFATNTSVDGMGNSVRNVTSRLNILENTVNSGGPGAASPYFKSNSTAAAAQANGADATAMGGGAVAAGDQALAAGHDAVASGAKAIAMGDGAQAQAAGSVALGAGASDGGRGAQSYTGQYSDASNNPVGTVSIGNAATGETRTLSNLADGKEANDAVNLRQLDGAVAQSKQYTDNSISSINNSVTVADNRLNDLEQGKAGMAQVNNSKSRPAPKATGGDSLAAGAGASASGDNASAIGNGAAATASNATAVGNGATASHDNSLALGANSSTNRANSVSVGSVGNERQVTNVAAATSDTDAVNLGQLTSSLANITQDANAYTDSRFSELKHDLKRQDDVLSAGIAGAMAMASLPQSYSPGASMVALGGAGYRGQSAVALGVSYLSGNGRWVTKAQLNTNSRNDMGVGIGVGYQF